MQRGAVRLKKNGGVAWIGPSFGAQSHTAESGTCSAPNRQILFLKGHWDAVLICLAANTLVLSKR